MPSQKIHTHGLPYRFRYSTEGSRRAVSRSSFHFTLIPHMTHRLRSWKSITSTGSYPFDIETTSCFGPTESKILGVISPHPHSVPSLRDKNSETAKPASNRSFRVIPRSFSDEESLRM